MERWHVSCGVRFMKDNRMQRTWKLYRSLLWALIATSGTCGCTSSEPRIEHCERIQSRQMIGAVVQTVTAETSNTRVPDSDEVSELVIENDPALRRAFIRAGGCDWAGADYRVIVRASPDCEGCREVLVDLSLDGVLENRPVSASVPPEVWSAYAAMGSRMSSEMWDRGDGIRWALPDLTHPSGLSLCEASGGQLGGKMEGVMRPYLCWCDDPESFYLPETSRCVSR